MASTRSYRQCAVCHLIRLIGPGLVSALLITGCMSTSEPSRKTIALLDNPPEAIQKKQDLLTPLTLQWFKQIESKYSTKGRELNDDEKQMAHKIGITFPERVRVVILQDFPTPTNQTLLSQAKQYGMGSAAESGRTIGYIVMLKAKFKNDPWILAHQLAYVANQEKMGRRDFIRRFIAERELLGNRQGPMEINAKKVAMEFK